MFWKGKHFHKEETVKKRKKEKEIVIIQFKDTRPVLDFFPFFFSKIYIKEEAEKRVLRSVNGIFGSGLASF